MTFGQLRFALSKFAPGVDPDLLDQWINARYEALWNFHHWLGRERDATLITVAPYSTGTVDLVNGSTSVAGSATTFTAGMTGRRIRIGGRSEWYTFTYVSAVSGTLDRPFEGDTDTGLAFEIFQNVYDLAADLEHLLPIRATHRPGQLSLWTQERLDGEAPSRPARGTPEIYAYAPTGANQDGTTLYRVELYPVPDAARGLPYKYRQRFARLTDTSTVLPDWISTACLMAGVQSDICGAAKDYTGKATYQADHDRERASMLREEARRRPNKRLLPSDSYARMHLYSGERKLPFNFS